MSNLIFERFIPKDKFKKTEIKDKKSFYKSIKMVERSLESKKSVFHTLSKKFKLNYNSNQLKSYRKYKRIIFIGMGGSILGAEAINHFILKKNNKDVHFINNLDLDNMNRVKKMNNIQNSLFVVISSQETQSKLYRLKLFPKKSFNKKIP